MVNHSYSKNILLSVCQARLLQSAVTAHVISLPPVLCKLNLTSSDDVLESFLSEYREKRLHRQQKGTGHFTHFINNDSCPTPSIGSTDQQQGSIPANQDDSYDTEDNVCDDDVCFTTPEDPRGVELVINLLTTWGDKFYIGLNGIELYTNTGEPAEIDEVHIHSVG